MPLIKLDLTLEASPIPLQNIIGIGIADKNYKPPYFHKIFWTRLSHYFFNFREAKGAYALEVEARDGAPSARPNSGGQPNSVTKYIRIGIADKNDNPPYFDKNLYEAEVDENEDIQHTVLTVTANDKDECKIFFFLESV